MAQQTQVGLNFFYVVLELRKLLSKGYFIIHIFSFGECLLLHVEIASRLCDLSYFQLRFTHLYIVVKSVLWAGSVSCVYLGGRVNLTFVLTLSIFPTVVFFNYAFYIFYIFAFFVFLYYCTFCTFCTFVLCRLAHQPTC